jgi:hypothetical protein
MERELLHGIIDRQAGFVIGRREWRFLAPLELDLQGKLNLEILE